MNEEQPQQCRHCNGEFRSELEKRIHVCFACRRYALLHGRWPELKDKDSSSTLLRASQPDAPPEYHTR